VPRPTLCSWHCATFHPKPTEYTLLSRLEDIYTKEHKIHLSKFKRREIIFSGYNGIKLDVISIKITGKPLNIWKLNHILLNNP
jgi:hypothetical protein